MNIESQLTALPYPKAPVDLAPNVMARIARVEDEKRARVSVPPRPIAAEWPAWALSLGSVLVAFGLLTSMTSGDRALAEVVASILIPSNSETSAIPVSLPLIAGVALYVLGLFGHVAGKERYDA
jgi:hypothetical protein